MVCSRHYQGGEVSTAKTMDVIKALRPDIVEDILDMRAQGKTVEQICVVASDLVGVPLGRELIRTYLNSQEQTAEAS
jgi:hypothetical protein